MELGTLAVGAMIAWRYRYPFLQMPIAVTLWYMSMDIAAMLVGGWADYTLSALVSMYFGLCMTLFAFWVDIRSKKSGDFAFWLYLFGVMAFWGGMTSQHSDSELSKFIYLCINLLLIGSALYLGHLANEVFKDSWLFPIALTAIGLGIMYLGILWQKNEQAVTRRVRHYLPQGLSKLLAER